MKHIQFSTYGGPEVLTVSSTAVKPALKSGQILVENRAASINAIDWKVRAGYLQSMMPLSLPVTTGGDFAGVVVEVEGAHSAFSVGDEVYGQAIILNGGSGTMAEFVAANTDNTALKPKSADFTESGALPLAGVSALQALEEHIRLQPGQKILIHGGAGGVGHMAVQYAKALGAFVAATAGAKDLQFVKSLGADEVIDYKAQAFERGANGYDAVFDTVGGDVTDRSFTVLRNGGILVSMAGQPNAELAAKRGVSATGQMTVVDTKRLTRLAELVDSGKISVHVDKVFPFADARSAFEYQENVHPQGKVVVTI